MEPMTCAEIAEALGKKPMHIGKVRNEVCHADDLDGRRIKKSGVQKILAHYGREMEIMETATPDVIFVEYIDQPVKNPRWLKAFDRERRKKVNVSIPKNRKQYYAQRGKRFLVERGSEDGKFYYQWKPNLTQS